MICLVSRWSLPAALSTAVFALTACAGSMGSSVPTAPDQIPPAGFRDSAQLHAMTARGEMLRAAVCPKKYINCFTVSRTKGAVIDWCYGTKSNPCGQTSNYTWSGAVCKASAITCSPIPQLTAAWTGPFPCKTSIKVCGGSTKGTYEVDTITPGKHPPKVNPKYAFKQAIILSGTIAGYIGLAIGP